MTVPTVTVAIPFHDEERHLADAIRSVLHQSFEDFELLLVDDGSTDRSLEIARSFRDARITVVSDGTRRGLPARLNQIVDRARAGLVARMDADDVMHPSRLAREIEYLRADDDCEVVGTWIALVDEHDVPFGVVETIALPPKPDEAIARGVLGHPSIVGRREWHRANRYDETLTRAEDRELWARTAMTTTFGIVQEPLHVMRVEPNLPTFVPNYLKTLTQNRRIFLRHGPRLVGLRMTASLCVGTLVRSIAIRVADGTGLVPRLVRRRGRPPTDHELGLVREALASAAQTP
jgi:glycosyltransferase involved in cell wall biosynthesis